ncbi:MAG: anti-repressor SinI family protein [Ectobacillus sp.]
MENNYYESLDSEWIDLMTIALDLGIHIEDVKSFLEKAQKSF